MSAAARPFPADGPLAERRTGGGDTGRLPGGGQHGHLFYLDGAGSAGGAGVRSRWSQWGTEDGREGWPDAAATVCIPPSAQFRQTATQFGQTVAQFGQIATQFGQILTDRQKRRRDQWTHQLGFPILVRADPRNEGLIQRHSPLTVQMMVETNCQARISK